MKIFFVGLLSLTFLLSGCLVRTRVLESPRVDREITGNRGCISGTCKGMPSNTKKKLSDNRLISVVEVELGKHGDARELLGYTTQEETVSQLEDLPYSDYSSMAHESMTEETSYGKEERFTAVHDDDVSLTEPKRTSGDIVYTVQKGDTLQKISQKFYGTTRKYVFIYEKNRDVLKSIDSLRVGQTLKIPESE